MTIYSSETSGKLLPDDTASHPGRHRCVVWQNYTDDSEESTASNFRVHTKL
jgi:hypothetical protein